MRIVRGCWNTEQEIQNFTERGKIKNQIGSKWTKRERFFFGKKTKLGARGLGKRPYLSSLLFVHSILIKRFFCAPEGDEQKYEIKEKEAQKEIGEQRPAGQESNAQERILRETAGSCL